MRRFALASSLAAIVVGTALISCTESDPDAEAQQGTRPPGFGAVASPAAGANPSISFAFSSLTLRPAQVLAGDAVAVSVTNIFNSGGAGTQSISLSVAGSVVDTTDAVFAAGASADVEFTYTPRVSGRHLVKVGARLGTLTVVEPPRQTGLSDIIALTRGPYLGSCAFTSVVVAWNTNVPGDSLVLFGPDPDSLRSVAYAEETVKRHAVTLTALSAGQALHYRVFTNGEPLTPAIPFKTNSRDTDFSFTVYGDPGEGHDVHRGVIAAMREVESDLTVVTGDINHTSEAEDKNYDKFHFGPYRDLIREQCFWPSIGNHDWAPPAMAARYLDAFHLPANNPEGSEEYYSFDFGNTHFIALNSNLRRRSDPQWAWVQRDLKAAASSPDIQWIFVFFHHPPYSSGPQGLNPQEPGQSMAKLYVPLFEKYGVTVVFSGHVHAYERTCQLRSLRCVAVGGIVYVVTGNGGNTGPAFNVCGADCFWSERYVNAPHFVRVEVRGNTLRIEAIASGLSFTAVEGSRYVIDSFVMEIDDTAPDSSYRLTAVLQEDPVGVIHAAEVIKRHMEKFLAIPGVIGVQVGVFETNRGFRARIEVNILNITHEKRDLLPKEIEGIPVWMQRAESHADRAGKDFLSNR